MLGFPFFTQILNFMSGTFFKKRRYESDWSALKLHAWAGDKLVLVLLRHFNLKMGKNNSESNSTLEPWSFQTKKKLFTAIKMQLTILQFSYGPAWLSSRYQWDDSACLAKSGFRPVIQPQKLHHGNLERKKKIVNWNGLFFNKADLFEESCISDLLFMYCLMFLVLCITSSLLHLN